MNTKVSIATILEVDLYTQYVAGDAATSDFACDAGARTDNRERFFLAHWTSPEELEQAIAWMRDWDGKTAQSLPKAEAGPVT